MTAAATLEPILADLAAAEAAALAEIEARNMASETE